MKPVHFDLEALERATRRQAAEAVAAAASLSRTDDDRQLVVLQQELLEMFVIAQVRMVAARNSGVDPLLVAQALGSMLGNIAATFIVNHHLCPDACIKLQHSYSECLGALLNGRPAPGGIMSREKFAGTPGGHA